MQQDNPRTVHSLPEVTKKRFLTWTCLTDTNMHMIVNFVKALLLIVVNVQHVGDSRQEFFVRGVKGQLSSHTCSFP
jgi:hypothetical protein